MNTGGDLLLTCRIIITGMPVNFSVYWMAQEFFVIEHSFSIIVPLYNSSEFMDKCLQSLKAQCYTNYEVILIDDGSHDNTFELCQVYEKNDNRFHAFTKNNAGQGVARNFGLTNASGDFIIYVDSDDYIEPNTLREINIALHLNPKCDIVNFLFDLVDDNGKVHYKSKSFGRTSMVGDDIFVSAMLDREILSIPWNKVYRKSFLNKYNITFPHLRRNEDIFYSRIIGFYALEAIFINKIFYHGLIRNDSTSRKFTNDNLKDSLFAVTMLKVFLQEKKVIDEYDLIFKAFIARHLSYLLVISAFRTEKYSSFKEQICLTKDFGLNDILKDKDVLNLLNNKQKIMSLLCRSPILLFIAAKLSVKTGLYNLKR